MAVNSAAGIIAMNKDQSLQAGGTQHSHAGGRENADAQSEDRFHTVLSVPYLLVVTALVLLDKLDPCPENIGLIGSPRPPPPP